ncbi:protein CIP2A homolog [Periplaneta americana]|uniref:protein CIP2A homolog n=1 Tax=Periplaneta americana TaxID=6978 RepID=UPI0037E92D8A
MRSYVSYTLLAALFLMADIRRSFVDPAPVENERGQGRENRGTSASSDEFDEVKQLEDLKHSFGKTFSVLKSHSSVFTNINGQREGHAETREQVNRDGKLVSRVQQKMDSRQEPSDPTPATQVRTEVEVPDEGVHRTLVSDSANVERRSNVEKYTSYAGVQYSPLDMAEYVFWTGDEKGVTLAIEEFLQEGLMTREEAITFLQEIKMNLEFLQTHYTQLRQHNKEDQQQAKERANMIQKALGLDKSRTNEAKMNSIVDEASARDLLALAKKNSVPDESNTKVSERAQQVLDEDYEELLERLRIADFLYTEYSLEEVIYQLAKVMFSQSLNRGSAEAQEALQKFTSFLETEAEQGHISRSLEKKVLDVLIASLTDTLAEHPHLVSVAREGLLEGSSGNQLLHQLLLLNPAAAVPAESEQKPTSIKSQGTENHQSTMIKGRENETVVKAVDSTSGKSPKAT